MAKVLKCDYCLKTVERLAAKIYLAPIIPGKSATLGSYSYSSECCADCSNTLIRKMNRRKARKKFPTSKLTSE